MATFEGLCAKGHHYIIFNVWEISTDVGANKSRVGWSIQMRSNPGWDFYTIGSTIVASIDGQQVYNEYAKRSCGAGTTVTWASGELDVYHNNDGTKTAYCQCDYTQSSTASYTPGNGSASGNIPLSNIPRNFSQQPSIWIISANETSATFGWSTSETCNWGRYHLDGSSGWTDVFSGSGTSGQFTVGGLSPGSSHNVYLECRRQDSSQWRDSNTVPFSVYDVPKPDWANNFSIGDGATVRLNNPLGRSVVLELISNNDGSRIGYYAGTYSGDVNAEFKTSSAIASQYASIPNKPSSTYYAKVSWNGNVRTTGSYTYSVKENENRPVFSTFTYEDVNATTLALTGDSSTCIKGYSTIEATVAVANKASAVNGASMKEYKLEITGNSTTDTEQYSADSDVVMRLPNAQSGSISVQAIDTRNIPKTVLINAPLIAYEDITKNVNLSGVDRTGGVSEFVTLTLKGKIWIGDFGNVENGIDEVTYRFKKTNGAWDDGTTTIVPSVDSSGNFSFEGLIAGNNEHHGFDIDSVYQIEVTVKDKLSSATFTFTLGSGKPHVAYYKDGVSIMGAYDEDLGGALQVNGIRRDGVYSTEEQKIGYLIDENGDKLPLYRKVYYTYTTSSSGNITYIILDNDATKMIKKSYGTLKLGNYDVIIPTPDAGLGIVSSVQKNQTNDIFITTNTTRTLGNLYCVLEYTKTTD